jgi:hypothetical protein
MVLIGLVERLGMNIRKIRVTLDSLMIEEAIDYILEQYYNLDPSRQNWNIENINDDLEEVELEVTIVDPEWDESKVEEDFVEVIDD